MELRWRVGYTEKVLASLFSSTDLLWSQSSCPQHAYPVEVLLFSFWFELMWIWLSNCSLVCLQTSSCKFSTTYLPFKLMCNIAIICGTVPCRAGSPWYLGMWQHGRKYWEKILWGLNKSWGAGSELKIKGSTLIPN